jgi:dephospho-CoA kinase
MLHIGLTGGIGSGKSTVAKMFEKKGVYLLDSDKIVRQLLRKGNEGYDKVVKVFGKEIIKKNGGIDKKKLAGVVFKDRTARKKLEKILHPLVIIKRREILKTLQEKPRTRMMVMSEAALIYEAGTQDEFDKIILVAAPEKIRIQRLLDKGWALEKIKERMKAQYSDEKKMALADFVIENGGSLKTTEKQAVEIYRTLLTENKNVR